MDALNILPEVNLFDGLTQYITSQTEWETELAVPVGLIDFDKELILKNFEDVQVEFELGKPTLRVVCRHKRPI